MERDVKMGVTPIEKQINSDYFRSLSALSGRDRVAVFVEGWDDVAFWTSLLSDFTSVQYDVMPPVREDLSKGKKVVLDFAENSGPFLWLAVDSDFDWILGDSTMSGAQMKQCSWLLQTYAYAIENLKCVPSSLPLVLVKSNKISSSFDFVSFFNSYSKTIYPLFLWYIWSAYSRNTEIFPLKRFSNAVALYGLKSSASVTNSLARVSKTVNKVVKILSAEYPEYVDKVAEMSVMLKESGVTEDSVFYYMQGHTLMDKVVIPLLQMISSELVDSQIDKINASYASSAVKQNQLDYFKNSIVPLKYCLNENCGYKSTPFYEMIKNDVISILNSR